MKQTLLLALACHLLMSAPAQSPPGFKWVKTIAFNPATSGAEIFDFCTDPGGNSYVYGIFYGSLNFGSGVNVQAQPATEAYFVAKYAPNGVMDWVQKIVAPNGGAIYAAGQNPGGISADTLGNVFISGQLTNAALDFGSGLVMQRSCAGSPMCSDVFVVKYNADGQAQWVTQAAGSTGTYQTATRLVTDPDGSIYITGNYSGQVFKFSNGPAYNNLELDGMYMAHLMPTGEPVQTWFFGNGNGYAQVEHMAISPQKQVIATGLYDGGAMQFGNGVSLETFGTSNASNYFVVGYSAQGEAQWAYNLYSDDYVDVLDVASDTSGQPYVVADFRASLNSGLQEVAVSPVSGSLNGILLHLRDSAFHPVVGVQYAGEAYPMANVAVDRYDRFFVSGSFTDAQVNVGDVTLVNQNQECDDVLLLSGLPDASPLNWVRSAGGVGCDAIFSFYFGRALSTDRAGDLYAVGSFHLLLQLDNFSRSGDGLFVTKLGTAIVPTQNPADQKLALDILPNPNPGAFSVAWTDFSEPVHFTLYDAQGRVCYRRLASGSTDLDFDLSLPNGLYVLELRSRNKVGQQKVLVTR